MAASRHDSSLAKLIHRSPVLDRAARRQWLAVLPHLTADDQERLREILLEAGHHLTPQPPLRHGEAGHDAR